jgi:hypothetical protein
MLKPALTNIKLLFSPFSMALTIAALICCESLALSQYDCARWRACSPKTMCRDIEDRLRDCTSMSEVLGLLGDPDRRVQVSERSTGQAMEGWAYVLNAPRNAHRRGRQFVREELALSFSPEGQLSKVEVITLAE